MAVGQGFVRTDRKAFIAKQSAKGTVPTTFNGVTGFTRLETVVEKEFTPGANFLGGGIYTGKAIGRSFVINGTAEGWVSLDLFPAFLFSIIGTKGTTTGAGADKTHPYTFITRNINLPYFSIYVLHGETTPGTGIMTELVRDCRISGPIILNFSSTDAVKFSFPFKGLQEGPGAGGPTLNFSTDFNIPAPIDSANNQYNFPSWFPAANTICATALEVRWEPTVVDGDPCLTNGEHSDTYITMATWRLNHTLKWTQDMVQVYNHINYGTASPSANASQLVAALKEGAFDFKVSSTNVIPTTSIPYSLAMSFPDLQWLNAQVSNADPDILTTGCVSFGSSMTATIINATSGTAMVI